MTLPSQQTPGPDHSVSKDNSKVNYVALFLAWVARFLVEARKAWVGFLVAGGASAIAQNVATLSDNFGWHNLVQGLVGGVLTAFVVYWVTNDMRKYDPGVGSSASTGGSSGTSQG